MKSPEYKLYISSKEVFSDGHTVCSHFDLNDICDFDIELLVDIILRHDLVNKAIRRRLLGEKPQPKDIFIHALSCLKDTGDIDVLVRALNWQQNDIAFLSDRLQSLDRSIKVADELRVKCARLQDTVNSLRERNAELVKYIKSFGYGTPKKSKKNPR